MSKNYLNMVTLGDVLDYEQPTNYIVDKADYSDEFEIPVLTAGKTFLLGYTDETHNVFENVPVIIFDDFTTAFKYVDFPFKVKSSAMKILKAKEEIADIKFLYYRMMKTGIDTQLHKRYWISKYSKVKIPLPPLEQQKKIAAILDAADTYRQKTKALITKYDALTQSLFLDMFGDPVRNPKGWERIKLEEIGTISSGSTPSRKNEENFNGDIPWVKTGEVNSKIILDTEEKISKTALSNSSCKLYPAGSLIIAMYGQGKTRGQVALLGIEASTNQACAVLTKSDKANFTFLYKLIQMAYSDLRSLGRGGNQPNLNSGILKKYLVINPPMELQNQFADSVKAIEAKKEQAQASLAQAENLFNSLLQRAFKGELV